MTDMPYAAARSELDAILSELEAGDLDVDLLAAKVRRASELRDICRAKVVGARAEIKTITG